MIIDYRYIENLSPMERNILLAVYVLIVFATFCALYYHIRCEKADERRVREKIEQDRRRIAEQMKLAKEKLEREQDARRGQFLASREFQDLMDIIFSDPRLPRLIELAEYGLFLHYDDAERIKIFAWNQLPVSRIEDGHLRLANEALAVLCREKDERQLCRSCIE